LDKNYEELKEVAELLKVLAHPVRLCIVNGLLKNGACNVTHMQNCLGMPQSTISQHLQKLRSAGIIEGDRKGLEITYKVIDERVRNLIDVLIDENL
jgi:DNA-binding transcriptional ArsR family regulator